MLVIAHRAQTKCRHQELMTQNGVRIFELDVHVVGGEVLASHFLPVHPALPRIRHDGWNFTHRPRLSHEPTLATVVRVLPADADILLDLKNDRGNAAAALCDLILRSGLAPTRCYVSSPNWSTLGRFRAAGFRTWRTVRTRRALAAAVRLGHEDDHAVTVWHGYLDPRTWRQLRHICHRIVAWTVNDLDRAKQLAELGVDGITSDVPAVMAYTASRSMRVSDSQQSAARVR
jgi:glycerophosphoryl diester phosphodiesterase